MIAEDELRIRQARFEPVRQANQSHYRELEKLRREFVSKFPPRRIPSLSLEDYVEGKDSKDSFCYWVERRWLEANGRRDLALNVEAVCRKESGAGYDIKSFKLDGTPKYIEVKLTTSKPPAQNGSVRFYISAGEFEQAQKLPNYYLFIVFDVKSSNPKIWRIRDPAKLTPGLLLLQPSAYYATLTAVAPKETDEHE